METSLAPLPAKSITRGRKSRSSYRGIFRNTSAWCVIASQKAQCPATQESSVVGGPSESSVQRWGSVGATPRLSYGQASNRSLSLLDARVGRAAPARMISSRTEYVGANFTGARCCVCHDSRYGFDL